MKGHNPIALDDAGWYTWYKVVRTGYGDKSYATKGRIKCAKEAWSQWLSWQAHIKGTKLDCGCTKYMGKIRLMAMLCDDHGLGKYK